MKKFHIAKEETLVGKIFNFIINYFLAPIFRLIWLKEVSGKENLPASGSYILAVNHQSYMDFIMLTAVSDRHLRFPAAEKFYDKPIWKFIMEYTGQIKIERYSTDNQENKKYVFGKCLEVLESGNVLGIFPQGTRSRNAKIEKTFTGVARFALKAKVPVVPVGIKKAFYVWPPGVNKPKFEKEIEIHFGKPMDFSQYYGKEDDKDLLRKITNEIMTEIARLSGKFYQPEV